VHRQWTRGIEGRNIGISLPGTGEAPRCPFTLTGRRRHAGGTYDELATAFQALVDNYIARKYPRKTAEVAPPLAEFTAGSVDRF